ncbi:major facilitator superfamily domain-containing protein [Chaetomium tenue]|uniref:Major facilitator superfamily domain-containing protein n=1 Tax=Chaetomium tenue TaxID=1854479 RepID=A0ACB7PK16_9PEZI|nr:major facilitator superfamily domain-containing protein [Chaetomium globosum]
MGFQVSDLWRTPTINPVNKKARSVPILNPIDAHGRVFFFSWLGFMLSFWAWYTFPPLLSVTIKTDLHLTSEEVANSNIISLVATLAVRFVAGPLCDQFGPRRVFSFLLLVGSIPIGLAPLIKDATGLYIIRLFIGILGGAFVPCQVWCTGWFDKNVVGTANALAGGWGNAGGGITYFIMPAVYDSLVHRWGHSPDQAWRITFVVPLVCLITCGVGLLVLCEDTPMGTWNDRHNIQAPTEPHETIVSIPGTITDRENSGATTPTGKDDGSGTTSDLEKSFPKSTTTATTTTPFPSDHATAHTEEIIRPPSLHSALPILLSRHALFHVATYACSFGGELAINSVLAAYYLRNFPYLGQTRASNYAAVFGFLNFVTRPLGGVVGDVLYKVSGGKLWWKKGWVHVCGVVTGVLLIVIGVLDPHDLGTMIGLVVLMAVFHEAGNGANFALIPHVFPHANGLMSGLTGAGGNLGGVVFAVVFRFMDGGTNYAKGFWVIGIVHVVLNLAVCWVPPIPKGQVGGR